MKKKGKTSTHSSSVLLARSQAKYALPRGGGPAPRTTRIFVARIPPIVSDVEFRQYFEGFGQVQVHWVSLLAMPHTHNSKQGMHKATQVACVFGWQVLSACTYKRRAGC